MAYPTFPDELFNIPDRTSKELMKRITGAKKTYECVCHCPSDAFEKMQLELLKNRAKFKIIEIDSLPVSLATALHGPASTEPKIIFNADKIAHCGLGLKSEPATKKTAVKGFRSTKGTVQPKPFYRKDKY